MLNNILKNLGLLNYFSQIDKYVSLLITKNKELNLFSRKITKDILLKEHIEDCLLPYKYFLQYNSITDLGTGGGLPGILLAIIFPSKKITLIEKSPKKIKFLEFAIKELNLKNVQIVLNNVQNIDINSEVITCRAFKSINEILQLTKNFFNRNGKYLLYKGKEEKIKEEINEVKFRFIYSIHKIENDFNKERHIVLISKEEE